MDFGVEGGIGEDGGDVEWVVVVELDGLYSGDVGEVGEGDAVVEGLGDGVRGEHERSSPSVAGLIVCLLRRIDEPFVLVFGILIPSCNVLYT